MVVYKESGAWVVKIIVYVTEIGLACVHQTECLTRYNFERQSLR